MIVECSLYRRSGEGTRLGCDSETFSQMSGFLPLPPLKWLLFQEYAREILVFPLVCSPLHRMFSLVVQNKDTPQLEWLELVCACV